jgi:hypothetical protein
MYTTATDALIIRDNVIHGMNAGIDFWGSSDGQLKNIEITDNEFYSLGQDDKYYGIMLEGLANQDTASGSYAAKVERNEFHDIIGDTNNPGTGIVITGGGTNDAYVAGNSFANVSIGVAILDGDVNDTCIVNNNFDNTISTGVYAGDNVVNGPVDATENWWGSAAGPAEGQVSGDVDYDPWCGDAECSTILPEDGEIELPEEVTTPDDIQTAINNAPEGTTIIIPAGTYQFESETDDGFVINKPNITIILSDGTVIQNGSPCFTVNASNTTITGNSAVCVPTGNSNGIVVEADEPNELITDIIIEGLEIDGTTTYPAQDFSGTITIDGNNVSLLDGNLTPGFDTGPGGDTHTINSVSAEFTDGVGDIEIKTTVTYGSITVNWIVSGTINLGSFEGTGTISGGGEGESIGTLTVGDNEGGTSTSSLDGSFTATVGIADGKYNNVVADDLSFRIDQVTGDGIHFAGAIEDVILRDNFIHDLDGDGVEFTSQPSGYVKIKGNLFKDNAGVGINNNKGYFFEANYNAWGDYDGPYGTNGDGVTSNVLSYPWTHVDLYMESSGTDVANEVRVGETITYTIKANLKRATGADFKLTFDEALLEVTGTTLGDVFTVPTTGSDVVTYNNNTGVIHFAGGYGVPGDDAGQNGEDRVLFTVTFKAIDQGEDVSVLEFEEDNFYMPSTDGTSDNIYATELKDGSVTIIEGLEYINYYFPIFLR